MSRLYKVAIVAAALALTASVALFVKARLDLQAARQEVQSITSANQFLRNTLEDMTVAMTAKDKQIDRLENTDCNGHEKAKDPAPKGPRAASGSRSAVVWWGN